jgi:hypothetical protein
MAVLLSLAKLEPYIADFLTSLAMALVLLRILWTFENQIIYRLLAGYELDRTLTLRLSEKSIFALMKTFCPTKVYLEPPPPESSDLLSNGGNDFLGRQLERLSRFTSRDEIVAEIDRIKGEYLVKQQELNCLENLLFLSDQDGRSTNSLFSPQLSRNNSSHLPSQLSADCEIVERGDSKKNGGKSVNTVEDLRGR